MFFNSGTIEIAGVVNGIDVAAEEKFPMMDTVMQALNDQPLTTLFVEHDMDIVSRYCDRVIGMRDGRIVFDGTPDQLTTNVARDIYGADDSFNESATSNAIPANAAYAETMLA